MDIDHSFWAKPDEWPRALRGYVFLLRAVHRTGSALYGDAWTGNEPIERGYAALPVELPSNSRVLERASALLTRHRPEDYATPIVPEAWTDELWSAARQLVSDLDEAEKPSQLRFRAAIKHLHDGMADGNAICVWGGLQGGGVSEPIPHQVWNTNDYCKWFKRGTMNRRLPLEDPTVTERHTHRLSPDVGWLFVEEASLNTFLGQTPTSLSGEYEAPYIRLMKIVSRELAITPDNQPRKEDIEDALIKAGKRPGLPKISPSLARYAATLMREVESQSGSVAFHTKKK